MKKAFKILFVIALLAGARVWWDWEHIAFRPCCERAWSQWWRWCRSRENPSARVALGRYLVRMSCVTLKRLVAWVMPEVQIRITPAPATWKRTVTMAAALTGMRCSTPCNVGRSLPLAGRV